MTMREITEGSARIHASETVFLNEKMHKLRDISVMFLKAYGATGSLLDCTCATGIRGIRYALEAGIKNPTLIDINPEAYKSAEINTKLNKVRASVINKPLQELAAVSADKFDIIDVDPFGSPEPFINDALRLSRNGSILMVTATDTAVLCGAHASACIKNYSSKPLHNELCKEVGARILLNFIIHSAGRFNFGVIPLLTISDMHYIRVFVKLSHGAENAVNSIKQTGFGSYCNECHSFSYATGIVPRLDAKCPVCKKETERFGPLFLGVLYAKPLLEEMVKINGYSESGAHGYLQKLSGELDIPLFYSVSKMTKSMGISSVSPALVRDALNKKGHTSSFTQFYEDGIKTGASAKIVAEVIKKVHSGKHNRGAKSKHS